MADVLTCRRIKIFVEVTSYIKKATGDEKISNYIFFALLVKRMSCQSGGGWGLGPSPPSFTHTHPCYVKR